MGFGFSPRVKNIGYYETSTDWNTLMFKRLAIQTQIVKAPKKTESPNDPTMAAAVGESSARLVNELAKDLVKYAAGAIVGGIVIVIGADTLRQIAVKKTKSADNE